MGIKGLKSFLQNIDNIDGISSKHLNYYRNKTLGVDLSILLHRAIYNNSNYISYFVNFILKLNKYKINPLFIFDGKPPKEKNNVLELRRKSKEKASKRAESLLELKDKINTIDHTIKHSYTIQHNLSIQNDIGTIYSCYELSHRNIIEKINLHLDLSHYFYLNKLKKNVKCDTVFNTTNTTHIKTLLKNGDTNDGSDTNDVSDNSVFCDTNFSNIYGDNNKYSKKYLDTILSELSDSKASDSKLNNSSINDDLSLRIINSDIQKNNNKSKGIKKQYIDNLKKLFNSLLIPYIHLDREADTVCKLLLDYDIIHGCVSDDMDMIPYKCQKIIQNINFSNDTIIEYDYDKIIKALQLNEAQMTDLCICCGTDFNNKLINIKCNEIYDLIKKYGNIEGIINHIDDINDDRNKLLRIPYQFEYRHSRHLFLIDEKNDLNKENLIDNIQNHTIPDINTLNNDKLSSYYHQLLSFLIKHIPEWSTSDIKIKINKLLAHFLKNNCTDNDFLNNINIFNNSTTNTGTLVTDNTPSTTDNSDIKISTSYFDPTKTYKHSTNRDAVKLNTKYTKKKRVHIATANKSKHIDVITDLFIEDEDEWQLVR